MMKKSKITHSVKRAPEQLLESSVSLTDRAGHPWGAGRWWFAACGLNAVCSFQLAPKLSKQVLQVHPGGRLGVPQDWERYGVRLLVPRELGCPA